MLARIRPRFTYANVIATIALFGVLAGGGAYAASKIGPKDIQKNAVRAKHIKNGQVKAADLRRGAVTPAKLSSVARSRWAEVDADGTLARGRGATAADTQPACSACYVVTFDRDMSRCSFTATPRTTNPNYATATRGSASNVVQVLMNNSAGGFSPQAFYLHVLC
jgi:hypothetical protein